MTVEKIIAMKKSGSKIAALTCYHAAHSKILDSSGIDIILVGDSLSMTLLGNEDTLSATLEQMLMFTKAVAKKPARPLIIADMPYKTYGINTHDTLVNARRFVEEAGADAVKLEGADEITEHIKILIKNDIPVMGHLGLTPQSIQKLGGFKVQGKTPEAAQKIKKDASILEETGVFALVLECVPKALAGEISRSLKIPVIGIGAGSSCDGQILVIDDILTMDPGTKLKFVKRYADLSGIIEGAVKQYVKDVKEGIFPDDARSF